MQIELIDENGVALDDFTDSVALEVTNGAIDPSSVSGFEAGSGSITANFRVSASVDSQTITVRDSNVNVSSQLAVILEPPPDTEVSRFDVEIPDDPIQFWGAFFPITITARNSEDVPLGNDVGQIDIATDKGELVLFDNGDEVSFINIRRIQLRYRHICEIRATNRPRQSPSRLS